MTPASKAPNEVVPLQERLRYMRVVRVLLGLGALVFGLVLRHSGPVKFGPLAVGTALYLLISLGSEAAWRLTAERSPTLFGTMLIVDSIYLAWANYATGGSLSPVRYLIVLHLVTVALLASYRTGLKIAMWQTLLLYAVYYAQESRILHPVIGIAGHLPDSEYRRLTSFVFAFWLVTIATAAFSAVNERELRRRRFDLESLAELGSDLEGAVDSFDVADALVRRVGETFDLPRVLLLGAPDDDLVLMARVGSEQPIGSVCPNGANSVLVSVWDRREALLVAHVDGDDDPWLFSALPDAQNLMVIPLSAEGRTLGVLIAEHTKLGGSRVERRVVAMLERFASHAALALRNAWLLEQVRSMAATDGLTGIANRRSFDAALEREVSRAGRNDEQMSLLLLDLDHFKQLNDSHGHQMGDDVLRSVAVSLQHQCRDFDTAARYGGEEFAVIMPGCSLADAESAGERYREAIERDVGPVSVTASVGVACLPFHAATATTLLKRADEALYESKRSGRNRVTVAASTENVPTTT